MSALADIAAALFFSRTTGNVLFAGLFLFALFGILATRQWHEGDGQ